jgi:hypothetical protein
MGFLQARNGKRPFGPDEQPVAMSEHNLETHVLNNSTYPNSHDSPLGFVLQLPKRAMYVVHCVQSKMMPSLVKSTNCHD